MIVGENAVPLEHVQSQLDVALAKAEQVAQLTARAARTPTSPAASSPAR